MVSSTVDSQILFPALHLLTGQQHVYISLNHKKSIPNFNGLTSLWPSIVRTLFITFTSQMGTNTLSSSGDVANWHWQQAALKDHTETVVLRKKYVSSLKHQQNRQRG